MMRTLISVSTVVLLTLPVTTHAQVLFDSGSLGGADLDIAASTTYTLPADGVIHAASLHVHFGRTLTFQKNSNDTPVVLLVTGDVTIDGVIDIRGQTGGTTIGGAGGPGGFSGGAPGLFGEEAGAGYGPGGGPRNLTGSGDGDAGHLTAPTNGGAQYGAPLLIPLIGGSGGGGAPGAGGGGGGGAILIASNTSITFGSSGSIRAAGGQGGTGAGAGSGGAVRLVSPLVQGPGNIDVAGGYYNGSLGRVRIDTLNPAAATTVNATAGSLSLSAFMVAQPPNLPSLQVISVGNQSVGAGGSIVFGLTDPTPTDVVVEGTNFTGTHNVELVLTPESGPAIPYQVTMTGNGATPVQVTFTVAFPTNVVTHVHAYVLAP